jgi:exonuclease SbcC
LDTCPAQDEIEQAHQAARQQWGELRDRLADIDRLEQFLKQQRAEQERVKQRLALDAARADLTQLQQQRQALSPELDTAAFEQRLQQAMRQARQALEQAQAAATEQQNSLHRRQQQISDLKRHMADLNTETARMQQAFDAALAHSQFADETSLQAALLPEEQLKTLQQAAEKLKADAARLQALQEQCHSSLQLLQQQDLTEQSSAELEAALERLTSEHAMLLQRRGSLQQTLDSNAERKSQFGAQQQAIDAQQRELERWDTLHALIGSADGKKFRNFAQGLTFELMIGHANRQLQKMSDRYLLVRDAEQPLELNVIDNYQAGEIRSTKNLSGGESFLISLALALGLSGMASRNVRVDSLFLDEGFGTLDEEALETALDTLSGLQQEGKLIGVISHVQALKDRIATRIEVQQLSGGRSRISGPGCMALSS